MRREAFLLLGLASLSGSHACGGGGTDTGDAGGDADVDGDTDADSDSDTNADTDTDSDTDSTTFADPWLCEVYDLASDWSFSENPFVFWTVRAGDVPMTSTFDDWAGITGQTAWANAATGAGHVPAFFQVLSAFEDLEDGDIALHSQDEQNGPGLGPAQVVWTSPDTGTIDVVGDIWLAKDAGRGNDWTLDVGGSELASGSLSDGDAYERATPMLIRRWNIPVDAGDEVVLEVVRTSEAGELTGVNMTITFRFLDCE